MQRLLQGGVSVVVELAGPAAVDKSAIDILSDVKYARMRAAVPILGSINQQRMVDCLRQNRNHTYGTYEVNEIALDGSQPPGICRSKDDQLFLMAQ